MSAAPGDRPARREHRASRPGGAPAEAAPGASANPERRWLESHGIRPLKRRGQNFLLDPRVPAETVRRAAWPADAPVLEIGSGGGALTAALLAGGRRVLGLEIDPDLAGLLTERFAAEIAEGRCEIVLGDARRADLAALASRLRPAGGGLPWLAGNLPYAVTTPLLLRALEASASFSGAVFMVQREYGERLRARPGEKAYSSLTVRTAAQAEARSLLLVGRSAFWPRPGVESMVVELRFPHPPPYPGEIGRLERVLRAAFGQRRKVLENALAHGLGLTREEARALLERAGCDPRARAEEVELDRFATLAGLIPEPQPEPEA